MGNVLIAIGGSQPYCESALPNTMGIGIDGGMAEKSLFRKRFLTPLPKSVSIQDAFLTEPLAVAVRSLLELKQILLTELLSSEEGR